MQAAKAFHTGQPSMEVLEENLRGASSTPNKVAQYLNLSSNYADVERRMYLEFAKSFEENWSTRVRYEQKDCFTVTKQDITMGHYQQAQFFLFDPMYPKDKQPAKHDA